MPAQPPSRQHDLKPPRYTNKTTHRHLTVLMNAFPRWVVSIFVLKNCRTIAA